MASKRKNGARSRRSGTRTPKSGGADATAADPTAPGTAAAGAATAWAAALGAASALWAAFLWQQLFVARRGGDPFCALGGEGCSTLWDGAFANAIHAASGIPVAGWGLAWGLVATVLPLVARRTGEPVWSATVVNALVGVGSVVGLAGASLLEGALCTNCLITYGLVGAHAFVVLRAARRIGFAHAVPGAGLTAAATGLALAAVLWPGLATPRGADPLGASVVESVQKSGPLELGVSQLETVIGGLDEGQRQALANARATWLEAEPTPSDRRPVHGSPLATLRLTTFTDTSCIHCANFHIGLEQLLERVPAGSVSIEQRMFPLDGSCNPHLPRGGHPERCLAAKVRLCLDDHPRAFALSGELHEHLRDLSEDAIYGVTEAYMPRSELDRCIESDETLEMLRVDIELAMANGIQGTPMLLLNDRLTQPNLPFLYAMAMTGGDANHPVFEGLPAANLDPHAGHDHAADEAH